MISLQLALFLQCSLVFGFVAVPPMMRSDFSGFVWDNRVGNCGNAAMPAAWRGARSSVGSSVVVMYNNKKKKGGKRVANPSKGKGFGERLKDLRVATFQYTGSVKPGKVSPQSTVPSALPSSSIPSYAFTSIPDSSPQTLPWVIEQKDSAALEKMEASGRLARHVLDYAGSFIKPGVTTDYIDQIVHQECLKHGAYPSPLNYHGFPKSCCTSINEVICHGIPDDRVLKDGDIVNLDITIYKDGFHGDCSEMFEVGEVDQKGLELIQVTYDCWLKAMEFCRVGRSYSDIGGIIEDYVEKRGYTTVRNFCGHGIGSVFHCSPNVLHYRNSEPNGKMEVGHVFTIEPMICEGSNKHVTWPDEWTAATRDGLRTAQFEHTLVITENGIRPLTGKYDGCKEQRWEAESEVAKGFWEGSFD